MDSSKPRGILASLEHKAVESPRRASLSTRPMRGPALVVGSCLLVVGVLAWGLYSGPSPVIVHEGLPPAAAFTHAQQPEPVANHEAAAIVDEAPPPASLPTSLPTSLPASSPALAAVLAPTPIATVVLQGERAARPHVKPKPKPKPVMQREQPRSTPRAAPDTDIALLSAIVAHAKEHDVVEPRAGDSTASLLRRCQRVGGEEGRLCHVRICATRVDDEACRFD